MDKGAHFFSCDFQVHSPRDRQWNGERPSTDEEKQGYAREFVAACRAKGVNAVAITDHHDLSFASIIREAAQNERDENAEPLPDHERLVVFPGMELTLGIPCQAILIFDADLPSDLFPLAFSALAITPAPDGESRTAETQRLDEIKSFRQLHELLDRHEYLRGRYIVLPNVSEGGTSTLLRSGHAGHYKDMPCVGGYVDGGCDQLRAGNLGIVQGKNGDYGYKRIAVFQTSDARRRDYVQLGNPLTWVKWATPTAEALRQACLAQESRISYVQPFIPPVMITSLQVSNSKFLGPVVLNFNAQYNAIIGGRGTGKSTILEYLRWGLCDDPPPTSADDENGDYRAKRRNLIEKTLTSMSGNVQINFLLNGVQHSVRRNSINRELMLKIGDADFQPCAEADIRSLLPIQSYSQKQLSQIGVKVAELNRFVRQGVSKELAQISATLSSLSADIRSKYSQLLQKRQLQKRLKDDQTEIRSLEEQVVKLRESLKGLEQKDQDIIQLHPTYDDADELVNRLKSASEQGKNALVSVVLPDPSSLGLKPDELKELPQRPMLTEIIASFRESFEKAREYIQLAKDQLNRGVEPAEALHQELQHWQQALESHEKEYEAAKTKSSSHQSSLDQLSTLETRSKTLRTSTASVSDQLDSAGNPEQGYAELVAKWAETHRQRALRLEAQCRLLTTLSGNSIRATVRKCALTADASGKLKSLVSGANIRTTKIESLFTHVVGSTDPIGEWLKVLVELELLASLPKESLSETALPATPIMTPLGFTPIELQKMAAKITTDSWLDLSLAIMEDEPVFEYKAREAEYIPFADASAGQQATALLWALLNQEGPPLVIDQPEDDLDNQVISKVVEQIWKAKPRRQLVFTSHNANLVVNGDAELVVCCAYRIAGDQSTGCITCEGAIDIKDVREEITKVMEGGEEAFRLRKEKYGF